MRFPEQIGWKRTLSDFLLRVVSGGRHHWDGSVERPAVGYVVSESTPTLMFGAQSTSGD